jgi:hypothetical protein
MITVEGVTDQKALPFKRRKKKKKKEEEEETKKVEEKYKKEGRRRSIRRRGGGGGGEEEEEEEEESVICMDTLFKHILQYPAFLVTSFARIGNGHHSSVCLVGLWIVCRIFM